MRDYSKISADPEDVTAVTGNDKPLIVEFDEDITDILKDKSSPRDATARTIQSKRFLRGDQSKLPREIEEIISSAVQYLLAGSGLGSLDKHREVTVLLEKLREKFNDVHVLDAIMHEVIMSLLYERRDANRQEEEYDESSV